MQVSQHWSYDLLKKVAEEESANRHLIDELKAIFQVDSVRRSENITNVSELLDYLERRDDLSEYNVEPLHEIAEHCGNERLLQSLDKYVVPKEVTAANPVNKYQEERLASSFRNIVGLGTTAPTTVVAPTLSNGVAPAVVNRSPYPAPLNDERRTKIYKLLATSLGSYWRRFGRDLGIIEGALDDIELKFPRDLPSRVYSLLRLYEEDPCHNERQHVLLICRALENCQRKDLRRKIEDIMCN